MDDAARLVLADRFEDDGDQPRALVLRYATELAHLPSWSARRIELTHAVRVLCAEHDARWRADLPRIPGVRFGSFASGFVQTVYASRLEDVARLPDHMDTRHLRRLVLDEHTEQTLAHPLDATWIRAFAMTDVEALDLEDLERLLHLPFMAHVRELALPNAEIQSEGAEAIARATHLRLTHLDLQDCYVGGAASARLAAAPHLSGLVELTLECNGSGYVDDPMIDDRGLAAVLEGLPALERLAIGGTRVTEAGLRDLFTRDVPLKHLDLGNLPLAGLAGPHGSLRLETLDALWSYHQGVVELGEALSELKVLRLGGVSPEPAGLDGVIRSPTGGSLEVLELSHQAVGRLGEREWPRLHTLLLPAWRIPDADLRALARARFPALRHLGVPNGGPMDVKALARAPWLGSLRVLQVDLGGSNATAVASMLSRTRSLTGLRAIGMPLAPAVLDALGALPELTDLALTRCPRVPEAWPDWVERLILLGVEESRLTAAAMQELVRRPWGRLQVLWLAGNEPAYPGLPADLATHAPELAELEVADPDAPPRHYPVRSLRIASVDAHRSPRPPERLRGPLDRGARTERYG